jgi:hypothetical protein
MRIAPTRHGCGGGFDGPRAGDPSLAPPCKDSRETAAQFQLESDAIPWSSRVNGNAYRIHCAMIPRHNAPHQDCYISLGPQDRTYSRSHGSGLDRLGSSANVSYLAGVSYDVRPFTPWLTMLGSLIGVWATYALIIWSIYFRRVRFLRDAEVTTAAVIATADDTCSFFSTFFQGNCEDSSAPKTCVMLSAAWLARTDLCSADESSIPGPNAFERSCTLERTAGQHEPHTIGDIVRKIVSVVRWAVGLYGSPCRIVAPFGEAR